MWLWSETPDRKPAVTSGFRQIYETELVSTAFPSTRLTPGVRTESVSNSKLRTEHSMQIAAGASKDRGNGPSNQFHSQLIRCTGIHVTSFVPCLLDCGASYAKMNTLSSSGGTAALEREEKQDGRAGQSPCLRAKLEERDAYTYRVLREGHRSADVRARRGNRSIAYGPAAYGPAHENAKSNSTRRFSLSGSCFHNFGSPLKRAVRACLRLPGQNNVISSVIDGQHGSASNANLGLTPILLRQPYTIRC